MNKTISKIISIFLCLCFLSQQVGFAQVAVELNLASHLSGLRNSLSVDKFRPLHLRYLSYDNLNNNFKILLDKGTDLEKGIGTGKGKEGQEEVLKASTQELLNYFFIGISLPNDSFWVNLRPDSPDNIIDPYLAQTDVGKILLEADLELKKDTALATSPQTIEGKAYWDNLYKKAEELFGTESITIPTLTRPWIVPGEIIIRESTDNAYIYKATLKVMLEQDYLAQGKGIGTDIDYSFKDERLKKLNEYSSGLIRETIIPKLTKDINIAKRYAPLRQVYYSLILAQWFKQKFYGQGGLYSHLIDKRELNNLTSKTTWDKQTYFKAYQTSFQKGEYNLKEPVYTPQGKVIRSYMSGGMDFSKINTASAPINSNRPLLSLTKPYTSSPINALGGTAENPFGVEIKLVSAASPVGELVKDKVIFENLLSGSEEEIRRISEEVSGKFEEEKFSESGGVIIGKEEGGKYIVTRLRKIEPNKKESKSYLYVPMREEIIKVITGELNTGEKILGLYHNHSFERLINGQRPGPSKEDNINEDLNIEGYENSIAHNRLGLVFEPGLDISKITPEEAIRLNSNAGSLKVILYAYLSPDRGRGNIEALGSRPVSELLTSSSIQPVSSAMEGVRNTMVLTGLKEQPNERYSKEASDNLRTFLKALGVPEGSVILNIGYGANPLSGRDEQGVTIYRVINVDTQAPFGIKEGDFEIWEKDFFEIKSDSLKELGLQKKPDVILFYNMRTYMDIYGPYKMYSPFLREDPLLNVVEYFRKAAELVATTGHILFVNFMPPEGQNPRIISTIVERLKDKKATIFKTGYSDYSKVAVAFSSEVPSPATETTFTVLPAASPMDKSASSAVIMPAVPVEDIGQLQIQGKKFLMRKGRKGDIIVVGFYDGSENLAGYFEILAKNSLLNFVFINEDYGGKGYFKEFLNSGILEQFKDGTLTGEKHNFITAYARNPLVVSALVNRGFYPETGIGSGFESLKTTVIIGAQSNGKIPLYVEDEDAQKKSAIETYIKNDKDWQIFELQDKPIMGEKIWIFTRYRLNLSRNEIIEPEFSVASPAGEKSASSVVEKSEIINKIIESIKILKAEIDSIPDSSDKQILQEGLVSGIIRNMISILEIPLSKPSDRKEAGNVLIDIISDNSQDTLKQHIEQFPRLFPEVFEKLKKLDDVWEGLRQEQENIVFEVKEEQPVKLVLDRIGQLIKVSSSPLENIELGVSAIPPADTKGGIDLRALPIVTQPIPTPVSGTVPLQTSFRDSPLRGQSLNLDAEWEEIENMLNAGIVPSTDRIKEHLQSCCQEKDFNQEIDNVLSCVADILRLEEERVASTDSALKEVLVLLESDKPVDQMHLALAQITIEPKEPKAIE